MAVASPSKEKTEAPPEQPCRCSPSRSARPDADASSDASSVHSGGDASADRRDPDHSNQGLSNRSEEYRLLFRLPPDEALVQDFNCALQENILLQGHMYLFLRHICFYSNIFGFETKKTIPFHEVTCVRKAKTAAIFPNAIEIVAGGKKHFFGSFLSRDEAYRLIIGSLGHHCCDAIGFQDCQDSNLGFTHEENASVLLEGAKESNHGGEESSLARIMDARVSECKPLDNGSTADNNVSEKLSEVRENGIEEVINHVSPVNSITWLPEDIDAPSVPEYFAMVAEAKFPICVEDFFSLFLSDHAANFLDDFHKRCGDKEFRCTPWRQDEQSRYVRSVSFLHPIKIYLGAKCGSCREVQKLRLYRKSHLVIETSQQISDAPFGDHFTVEGRWDIEQDSIEENMCNLRVFLYVAFSKKTIFRGKIEQSTKDECRDVYAIWIKIAHELLKQRTLREPKGHNNQSVLVNSNGGLSAGSSQIGGSLATAHLTENAPDDVPVSSVPDTRDLTHLIDNPVPVQGGLGKFSSIISVRRDLWATLTSYTRTNQFSSMLIMAFVAVLILMQITIILLPSRSHKVYLVTDGNYGTPGSYSRERIDLLGKRFIHLKEEMHMLEAHMERMRHELAWLKEHLESLERLKSRSWG